MKQNSFDVAIIGGGASGLFCAAIIKQKSPTLSVAVLEKQGSVGKKLLATGNGRCNLTNIYATEDMYHGTFKEGAANLLRICSPQTVIELFSDMGLFTTVDSEGRVYPLSKSSASVLDVLTQHCKSKGVNLLPDTFVTDINRSDKCYEIICEHSNISANKLIIATGSKATPETGADDSLLIRLSEKYNLKLSKLTPALCPVQVNSKTLNTLKGVRAIGKVAILSEGKELKSEYGEIQFTDKTLSGICVFNLSRIANTINNSFIRVSLLPEVSSYKIIEELKRRIANLPDCNLCDTLLCGMFNRKIIYALLKDAGISKEHTLKELTETHIQKIAHLINNWDFPVIKSSDFSRAQVVHGGIHGNEINPDTMESKKFGNLYIIGEATDCDGDCGGLNLQFAFSSAYCAALDVTK